MFYLVERIHTIVEIDDKIEDLHQLEYDINNQIMQMKMRKTRIKYRIIWGKNSEHNFLKEIKLKKMKILKKTV